MLSYFCFQSTWKMGLRNSFKNFRRDLKEENSDDTSVPTKRPRLMDENLAEEESTEDDLTEEEYDEAVEELQGMGADC